MGDNHFDPLFIGHGSPMNAIVKISYTGFLNDFARTIALHAPLSSYPPIGKRTEHG